MKKYLVTYSFFVKFSFLSCLNTFMHRIMREINRCKGNIYLFLRKSEMNLQRTITYFFNNYVYTKLC